MQIGLPQHEHIYQNHELDSTYWDRFTPRKDDVIIATSLKAGTTWMQTIVANLIFQGQELPSQLETMVVSIASNPIGGTITQSFEVVGITTVNWGFSLGAYLFFSSVILRITSGILLQSTGKITPTIQISEGQLKKK